MVMVTERLRTKDDDEEQYDLLCKQEDYEAEDRYDGFMYWV